MRIVASWFGSNGSTVYKDVAAGFDNHRQLESGLHLVSLLFLSQVIGPQPARVEPKNGSIDCAGGTRCERKNQAAGFRANFTGAEVSYHLTSNAPYKGGVH